MMATTVAERAYRPLFWPEIDYDPALRSTP